VTFAKLPGVTRTRVGYTGGSAPNPTYGSVCGGDGHTEALQIKFNPAEISYAKLLDVFFSSHTPTGRNKPQYKSAIWFHSPEQKVTAQQKIDLKQAKLGGTPVVTDLLPAKQWFDAEEYHQKYIEKQTGRFW